MGNLKNEQIKQEEFQEELSNQTIYYGVKANISNLNQYLYSSNEVKDIISATNIIEFIERILGHIIIEDIKKNNVDINPLKFNHYSFGVKTYENNIEYRGSFLKDIYGKNIYMFKTENDARLFNELFSKYILENFDGVEFQLALVELEINETEDNSSRNKIIFDEFHENLENQLLKKEYSLSNNLNQISFGMHHKCPYTGSIASHKYQDESKYISKEIYDKKCYFDQFIMGKEGNRLFNLDKLQKYNDIRDIKIAIKKLREYYGFIEKSYSLENAFKINDKSKYMSIVRITANKIEDNITKLIQKVFEIGSVYDLSQYINLEELTINLIGYLYNSIEFTKDFIPLVVNRNEIIFIAQVDRALDLTKSIIDKLNELESEGRTHFDFEFDLNSEEIDKILKPIYRVASIVVIPNGYSIKKTVELLIDMNESEKFDIGNEMKLEEFNNEALIRFNHKIIYKSNKKLAKYENTALNYNRNEFDEFRDLVNIEKNIDFDGIDNSEILLEDVREWIKFTNELKANNVLEGQ